MPEGETTTKKRSWSDLLLRFPGAIGRLIGKSKWLPGIEPGTIWAAIRRSTTELQPHFSDKTFERNLKVYKTMIPTFVMDHNWTLACHKGHRAIAYNYYLPTKSMSMKFRHFSHFASPHWCDSFETNAAAPINSASHCSRTLNRTNINSGRVQLPTQVTSCL